jgi:Tfp pilus assembly protein PilO
MPRFEDDMKKNSWSRGKIAIGLALAALLAMDAALLYVRWQGAHEAPYEMRAQRDRLQAQAKLLRADVQRGEKIRDSLPKVGKDCDAFYHESFLDPKFGYSEIESDLGAIAQKAGLKTSAITFREKALKDHGVTEIGISTSVEGSYNSILHFISGLEQSKKFYLLNDLRLDSATTGGIRLRLELQTYFRT